MSASPSMSSLHIGASYRRPGRPNGIVFNVFSDATSIRGLLSPLVFVFVGDRLLLRIRCEGWICVPAHYENRRKQSEQKYSFRKLIFEDRISNFSLHAEIV